jgi:hypothetical protein
MSYRSVVLSKAPIAFFACDELSGTEMADSSGNDYHGVYRTDVTFGVASPIETDPTSHAFEGGGSSSAAPLPVNAFSFGGWGLYVSGATSTVVARSGQPGVGVGNFIAIDGGSMMARLTIFDAPGGGPFDLFYALPTNQRFYRGLVTRNGNVMRLYVNGVLRAERTDLPTGAITHPGILANTWKVGISGDNAGNVFAGVGTCMVDIYDYALTAADELEIYEAALASLPLRATITINVAVELNTDQIVPTDLPFAHNYSQTFGDGSIPIVETIEFQTNTNQSEPDYQQRISARPHGPLRSFEYHLSPTSGAARARLQGELYTPGQFYCVPVWSDSGVLTAQATSGTNTLSLDTTKRDYEVGSYVGFCSDLGNPATFQFYKITAVADAQITLDSNISTTVASGKPVFPARVASLSDDSFAMKSFAADHEDTVLRFELIESELSTRRITAYTPSTTYLSKEVFTLETAKVSFLDDRPYSIERRIQSHGRDYQFAKDTGSPQTFPVRFLLTTRAALSEFFGWLDARQGKLNPLWVSSKERDLIATARPTGTTLTVTRTGFSLHHGRRHLEITAVDGSTSRYRVTGVVSNGATETWSVDTPMPVFADIAKVSFLKYCTLAQDTISIRYFKGGSNGAVIAESAVSFRELLTSPE